MRVANIFFVNTPFQNYIVHHMVQTVPEFRCANNYLVVDMEEHLVNVNQTQWAGVTVFSPPIGKKFLQGGRERRKFVDGLTTQFQGYQEVRVFVSQIYVPFNNAVFGLAKKVNNKFELNIFPEGMANVVPAKLPYSVSMKAVVMHLYGRIAGYPYALYTGDISGMKYAARIYSLVPSAINEYDDKVVAIPLPTVIDDSNIQEACLVLGQFGSFGKLSFQSRTGYEELIGELIRFATTFEYDAFLYKPHHHEPPEVRLAFAQAGFEIIEDTRPIEEYFSVRPLSHVVSFTSSALLHLKLLYGPSVQCTSFKGGALVRYSGQQNSRWLNVKQTFREFGVEVIE